MLFSRGSDSSDQVNLNPDPVNLKLDPVIFNPDPANPNPDPVNLNPDPVNMDPPDLNPDPTIAVALPIKGEDIFMTRIYIESTFSMHHTPDTDNQTLINPL